MPAILTFTYKMTHSLNQNWVILKCHYFQMSVCTYSSASWHMQKPFVVALSQTKGEHLYGSSDFILHLSLFNNMFN